MEREVFKADWENGSRALLTSPLAVLCQGRESGPGTRLPELCSKLSHLSLTLGHLQRLFPSFISRILSQCILRYDQTGALETREQCLAQP